MALHWKALLMAVALLPFGDFGISCDIRGARQRRTVAMLTRSVEAFRNDCGRLPHSLEELVGPIVVTEACLGRPYAKARELTDYYGNMHYWKSSDDSAFVVRSVGRDRVFASSDDFGSDYYAKGGWRWPWRNPHKGLFDWTRPIIGMLIIPLGC